MSTIHRAAVLSQPVHNDDLLEAVKTLTAKFDEFFAYYRQHSEATDSVRDKYYSKLDQMEPSLSAALQGIATRMTQEVEIKATMEQTSDE